MDFWLYVLYTIIVVFFASGIKIVRPTEKGLIEFLGKYKRFAKPGFNWVIPIFERIIKVNITEMMVDAQSQEIITKDNLNARVDAQVYFKVKPDEMNVKASQYNVFNYSYQIVNLARTTLRNIIGNMSLKDANSKRDDINKSLMGVLIKETKNWGIEIVRTELKEIQPPQDVQDVMNQVVIAENKKIAATDFATATETEADGRRRAKIKEAEGFRQAKILEAEGEAKYIQLVNDSANKYFVGNAQLLKKLEVTNDSLKDNAKIIVPSNSELVNVIGELSGMVLPLRKKKNN